MMQAWEDTIGKDSLTFQQYYEMWNQYDRVIHSLGQGLVVGEQKKMAFIRLHSCSPRNAHFIVQLYQHLYDACRLLCSLYVVNFFFSSDRPGDRAPGRQEELAERDMTVRCLARSMDDLKRETDGLISLANRLPQDELKEEAVEHMQVEEIVCRAEREELGRNYILFFETPFL